MPHANTRPLAHSPTRPHAHSPTRPLAHSPTRPHARSPTRPHAHSPTRPLAHLPTRPLVQRESSANQSIPSSTLKASPQYEYVKPKFNERVFKHVDAGKGGLIENYEMRSPAEMPSSGGYTKLTPKRVVTGGGSWTTVYGCYVVVSRHALIGLAYDGRDWNMLDFCRKVRSSTTNN